MTDISKAMSITEGIEGYYNYHLCSDGKTSKALCGAATMQTYVPLSAWGTISHLNESWCKKCKAMTLKEAGNE